MATAPLNRQPVGARPPSPLNPLVAVFGFAALAGIGLIAGGFVLPKTIEWPQAPASAAMIEPIFERVSVPMPKAVEVAKAPAKPKRILPNLEDPTTTTQRPAGPAYQLAKDIDRQIDTALTKAAIPASPLATDAEFLRRVYLDLTGRVPGYDKTIEFLADRDPQKRSKVIDDLLADGDYGRHFAKKWADLLVKRDPDANRNLKSDDFVAWLAKRLNVGEGWDTTVTAMVTATGAPDESPEAFFFLTNQDNNQPSPAKLVGTTSNLFLGLQIQCAECHVHPTIDKWTQQDFWGLAAFFGHTKFDHDGKANKGQVARVGEVRSQAEPKGKAAKKSGEKAIPASDTIKIPDPTDPKKSTGVAKAKYFEGKPANLSADNPLRPKFAVWLTSKDNKYFARAGANRLWAHFFARGLVNPIEDMGPNCIASHPELLDRLAADFVKSGFDSKFLIRAICNSDAYSRTSKPIAGNESDETLLSHVPVKVLGARELLDSLSLVAAAPHERNQRQPNKNKGISAPANGLKFFDKREYDDSATEFNYGIPQMLKQMNTGYTNNIASVVSRFAQPGRAREEVIVDLSLAALGRRPKPNELDRLAEYCERQTDGSKALQDVYWAMLNSSEFISNH